MYTTTVTSRVTSMLLSNSLYASLQQSNKEMQKVQEAITSGQQINKTSDDPARVSVIQFLRQQIAAHQQNDRNLQHASAVLDNIDSAMSEASSLIIDATGVASSQIGVGSDTATRSTEAEVVQAQLDALVDIANRQYSNLSLFGGRNGAAPGGVVFESFLGGLRYTGHEGALSTDVGTLHNQVFTSNGVDAFGALSSRVISNVELQPALTEDMRLSDVRGTTMQGVHLGAIDLNIDGVKTRLDLGAADTVGDVVTRINNALGGAGSVAVAGEGFELTANAGHSIDVTDVGTGIAAKDLGLLLSASGGAVAGGSVHPKLTPLTKLSDLGASVDWTSGLLVTQGPQTVAMDFSNCDTVQDLINEVQRHNLGVRMLIDQEQGSLSMVSEVSGIAMSIGENGGTTATDLGLRSLDNNTSLDLFRLGVGIETKQGASDMRFQLHDGTTFEVNLDAASTVGEMTDLIKSAATSAGVAPGAFEIDMPTTGNGLIFRDNTAGGEDFRIDAVDESTAAIQLGIAKNAGNQGEIVMADTAQVRVENVFTHLMDLRDALRNDDSVGITIAGGRLQSGVDQLTQARSLLGVQAGRVAGMQGQSTMMKTAQEAMLSDVRDADLTQMITRFTQLQQQLMASMQVGSHTLTTSFMDYL